MILDSRQIISFQVLLQGYRTASKPSRSGAIREGSSWIQQRLSWSGLDQRRIWRKSSDLDLNLYIWPDIIKPVNVVRDLGVYMDSELSMEHHISTVVRACFFHFRRLESIRRILGADVTSGLVSAFVTTKMDYCNSILAALPQSSIDPLQRVQKAAARLITGTRTREHITLALQSLHWLPLKFRITFKLCVLMHLVHISAVLLPTCLTW